MKFFLSPDDLTMRPLPNLSSWTIPATRRLAGWTTAKSSTSATGA
jgi:hypothetical protein